MSFRSLVVQPLLREQARLERPRSCSASARCPTTTKSENEDYCESEEPLTDPGDREREPLDLGSLNRQLQSLSEDPFDEEIWGSEGLLSDDEQSEWRESLDILAQGLGGGGPRRLPLGEWLRSVA